MLFLVDEMFKQTGKTITMHFGETIPWETFDKSKSDTEWADTVKQMVYKIRK